MWPSLPSGSFREALITIIAVNAPALTPHVRRDFWSRDGISSAESGRPSKSSGVALQDAPPTVGGTGQPEHGSRKGGEIYKMTEFETSSRESTSNLVELERNSRTLPENLRT